nr:immunoglobulin light chain junction region [Homo sapiens]
CMQGTHWPPT